MLEDDDYEFLENIIGNLAAELRKLNIIKNILEREKILLSR